MEREFLEKIAKETQDESKTEWSNASIRIEWTLTGEGGGASARSGRVSSEMLAECVPDIAERTVFCCGPVGQRASWIRRFSKCMSWGATLCGTHRELRDGCLSGGK